jgi:hypothetical protein
MLLMLIVVKKMEDQEEEVIYTASPSITAQHTSRFQLEILDMTSFSNRAKIRVKGRAS